MAHPSIASPGLVQHAESIALVTSKPKPANLLQRIEEALRHAFGESDENIANSLRGF